MKLTKKNKKILFISIGVVALIALTGNSVLLLNDYITKIFLRFEGFSSKPYWDYKQWSWGYGTKVPGSVNDPNINPGGTITRAQALLDSFEHINQDRSYLESALTVPLKPNQLAALLSFSYNLGPGNADNLIPLINASPNGSPELQQKWNQYVYAGGVIKPNLVSRRKYEYNLFTS
jgi:GH24 family phage-related lysozyme (muramidase)